MIKPEKSGGVELFLRQTDNKTSRAAGTVPLSGLNRNEIIDEWAMHRALSYCRIEPLRHCRQ
jgi:hypothetical protein